MPHPKTELNNLLKERGKSKAKFSTESRGADHDRTFAAKASTNTEVLGCGEGKTKREAERRAAEQALEVLNQLPVQVTEEDDFEGPWPVFEAVLASCLKIAHERTDPKLSGPAALRAVKELALDFYKALLKDLGDIVEVPEE
jgi:ribonuclease-3